MQRGTLDHRQLKDELEQGSTVTDRDFDSVFPPRIRGLSFLHWTPVNVALKAIRFLARNEEARILDVGSGVGKFCLLGGIVTPNTFCGVEKRTYLVEAAQKTVRMFGLNNVKFINQNAFDVDWNGFDSFYFFNPFYEHVADSSLHIDQKIIASREKFEHYITTTQQKLTELKEGTRVVTYSGIGGDMPTCFSCVWKEEEHGTTLAFWIKMS